MTVMSQQGFFDTKSPVAAPPTQEDEAYREAMSRAGAILARRAHSAQELKEKLALEPELSARVLGRLSDLGLVDDAAFAEQWVEANQDRKGIEALKAGLAARGVDVDVADRVLERAAEGEQERANVIAARYLPRVIERPLPSQAAALLRTLMGRGFSLDVAQEAVRAALPPEGWD